MNQEPTIFFARKIENKIDKELINNNNNKINLKVNEIENSELWDFYDEIGSSETSNENKVGKCISCGSTDQIENGKTNNQDIFYFFITYLNQ